MGGVRGVSVSQVSSVLQVKRGMINVPVSALQRFFLYSGQRVCGRQAVEYCAGLEGGQSQPVVLLEVAQRC